MNRDEGELSDLDKSVRLDVAGLADQGQVPRRDHLHFQLALGDDEAELDLTGWAARHMGNCFAPAHDHPVGEDLTHAQLQTGRVDDPLRRGLRQLVLTWPPVRQLLLHQLKIGQLVRLLDGQSRQDCRATPRSRSGRLRDGQLRHGKEILIAVEIGSPAGRSQRSWGG